MDDKVQLAPELIRPNQLVNLMRGLWRGGIEMVQLCVDASTWSMVAILEMSHIAMQFISLKGTMRFIVSALLLHLVSQYRP